jgi:formylglycine-generating enzyme required for sulfatase activity
MAEDNFNVAQQKTEEARVEAQKANEALSGQKSALEEVVRLNLKAADALILVLDYEGALAKINASAKLGVSPQSLSNALLEIAYWYSETGQIDRASSILDSACQLVHQPMNTIRTRSDARSLIYRLNAASFDFLEARYYPNMIPIPGGTDTIGGTYPGTMIVTLSPYLMARTETSWWQFMLYCNAVKAKTPGIPNWGLTGNNPVLNISWYDAIDYANWLSQRQGLKESITGEQGHEIIHLGFSGYRLPTEAEWEFAALAGRNYEYSGSNDVGSVAWYFDNSANRTHVVGQKTANDFGLYDMCGNVLEWCWDWFDKYPSVAQKNPIGPTSGLSRVLRGGAWYTYSVYCRVSDRSYFRPDDRYSGSGFRLVRTR